MILHILKKDLKLVWPAIAAVAVLKLAAVWAVVQMGIFAEHGNLLPVLAFIELGCAAMICFAIIWALQSDPVVSGNADWLTRPVSRLDLFVAKALLAFIVTFVPVFVVNLAVGISHGLAWGDCFTRSFVPGVVVFLLLGLPALAMGAITSNGAQVGGIIGAVLIVWVLAILAQSAMAEFVMLPGGSPWLINMLQFATVIGASSVILGLQYSGHRTLLSRSIFAVAVAALVATIFVPWTTALQIQRVMHAGAKDAPVRVSFNSQAKIGGPPPADGEVSSALYIPLNVAVDDGSIANIDGVHLQLKAPNGQVLYDGAAGVAVNRGNKNLIRRVVDATSMSSVSSTPMYLGILMPFKDYIRLRSQTVQASFIYDFTAYRASGSIQAVVQPGQRLNIPHVGICKSRRSPENPTYTDMFCFPATDQATCLGGSVRYLNTGEVTPLKVRCHNEFRFWLNSKEIIAPGHLAAAYPTPVGNSAVQMTITPYQMRSHYTQTVVLPPMRLENLTTLPNP